MLHSWLTLTFYSRMFYMIQITLCMLSGPHNCNLQHNKNLVSQALYCTGPHSQGYWKIAYELIFLFRCSYGRIMYRFPNKAKYWSKNTNFSYPPPADLYSHLEPLEFLFFFKILITTVRVPKLVDGAKILPKSSTLWVKCTDVTDDRRTDGRTDGRTAHAIRQR